jgi:hypothetical protein
MTAGSKSGTLARRFRLGSDLAGYSAVMLGFASASKRRFCCLS